MGRAYEDGVEMSWEATSAVVQRSKQKGSGYLLMLLLANHADGNGYSWYGVRRLAAETRLSQRNVRYLIRKSEALGELEVFIGQGEKGTNLYRVTSVPDHSGRAGKSCLSAKFAPQQGASAPSGNRASQPPAIAVAAESNGSINQTHRESKVSELEEWYDRDFLPLYPPPRRDDQRLEALAELRKLGPRRRNEVIAGLKLWAVTWTQNDGGKFAPGPGKFLKARIFERTPSAAVKSRNSVGGDSSPYHTGAGERLKRDQETLERERAAQSPEQRAAECQRVREVVAKVCGDIKK
jgi:hypothetical protein